MAEECYTLIPGIYWDLEGSTTHVYGKGTAPAPLLCRLKAFVISGRLQN